MTNNTREDVLNCLVKFLEYDERPTFTDATWIEDFSLDSLGLFHFLLDVEKTLDLSFSEDDLNFAKIQNFEDLIELVDRQRSEGR